MDFQNLGIAVIPVLPKSKKPAVRWQKYQTRLPTESELRRWFRPGREINRAAICGWKGLTVLDFDALAPYSAWLAWAMAAGGSAREVALGSYRVCTSRGMHVYLFCADRPRCGHFRYGDVKGQGGYVLIPPSVHPSGVVYRAEDEQALILAVDRLDDVAPGAARSASPPPRPLQHVWPASALWPGTVIDEIRAQLPILSFFPEARPTGGKRWFMTKCPFHDDRHASLWIDAERGICACYAGCTPKPLDVIDLYARLKGIDNRQAIRELAKTLTDSAVVL